MDQQVQHTFIQLIQKKNCWIQIYSNLKILKVLHGRCSEKNPQMLPEQFQFIVYLMVEITYIQLMVVKKVLQYWLDIPLKELLVLYIHNLDQIELKFLDFIDLQELVYLVRFQENIFIPQIQMKYRHYLHLVM